MANKAFKKGDEMTMVVIGHNGSLTSQSVTVARAGKINLETRVKDVDGNLLAWYLPDHIGFSRDSAVKLFVSDDGRIITRFALFPKMSECEAAKFCARIEDLIKQNGYKA